MRSVLTAIVVLALAGCADKPPDRATVTGVVRYQDKPVTQGFVIFINKLVPTKQDQAPIRKDGSFEMTNAPLGECKVVIQVNPARPAPDDEATPKDKDKEAPPDVVPAELGAKYAKMETTPVEKTVNRGENRIDLEIK